MSEYKAFAFSLISRSIENYLYVMLLLDILIHA